MTKLFQNYNTHTIKYAILSFMAFTIFSCEDDPDLGPLPTVEIEVPNFGEANVDISFGNNSSGASGGALTYLWDFGDGTQSTNANPNHEYDNPGQYVVSLTATTEMGASETVMDSVIIGERFLTSVNLFYVDTIAFINLAGDTIIRPWDKDNGPDLLFDLIDQNDNSLNSAGQVIENAPSAALETPVTITASGDFKLSNDTYTVVLADIDENEIGEFTEDEDFDDFEEFDIIVQGTFNPASQNITLNPNSGDPLGGGTLDPGIDPETGEGLVFLTDGSSFVFEIFFQVKLDD